MLLGHAYDLAEGLGGRLAAVGRQVEDGGHVEDHRVYEQAGQHLKVLVRPFAHGFKARQVGRQLAGHQADLVVHRVTQHGFAVRPGPSDEREVLSVGQDLLHDDLHRAADDVLGRQAALARFAQ